MKVTVIPIVVGALGTIPKETRRQRNKRTSRDHQDYSLIKTGQNTEISAEDLRRLAVTQM